MSHSVVRYLVDGLLLGWGAAIPLGPMNIEVVRRHLTFGLRFGLAFGFGAAFSDLTYFFFVYFGLIHILSDHAVFHWLAWVSIVVLLCFAVGALRAKAPLPSTESAEQTAQRGVKSHRVWAHGLSGYAYTLINPYTVIFWVAVAAQIATMRDGSGLPVLLPLGIGVMVAVFSWVISLNAVLHRLKKRIKPVWMKRINCLGAACLFLFVLLIIIEILMRKI